MTIETLTENQRYYLEQHPLGGDIALRIIDALTARVAELERLVAELPGAFARQWEAKVAAANARVAKLEQQVYRERGEHEDLRLQLDAANARVAERSNAVNSRLFGSAQADFERAESEAAALRVEVELQQTAGKVHMAEAEALRAEIKQANELRVIAQRGEDAACKTANDAVATAAALRAERDECRQTNARLGVEVARLRDAKESLRAEVAAYEANLVDTEALRAELKHITGLLDAANEALEKPCRFCEALRAEVELRTSERNDAEAEAIAAEREAERLRVMLDKAIVDTAEDRSRLADATELLGDLEKMLTSASPDWAYRIHAFLANAPAAPIRTECPNPGAHVGFSFTPESAAPTRTEHACEYGIAPCPQCFPTRTDHERAILEAMSGIPESWIRWFLNAAGCWNVLEFVPLGRAELARRGAKE
jgi:chromosome segregation ATPase